MSSGRVRVMSHDDLAKVLAWRNRPEVRNFMFSRNEISFDEHARWYERSCQDSKRHLLMFELDGRSCGFTNIGVSAGGVAEWGFYVDPDMPLGTGMRLGECVLNHAFGVLGFHKVTGSVLEFNERSRRFHLRLGFQQEALLRDQHYDGENYHDVLGYGLLASDWLRREKGEIK